MLNFNPCDPLAAMGQEIVLNELLREESLMQYILGLFWRQATQRLQFLGLRSQLR